MESCARRRMSAASAAVRLALLVVGGCDRPEADGLLPVLTFGGQGLGPGQFVYPRAIALAPDGCVFVVDKTARIQRFSGDGEFETSWQMPEWEAGKPTGLFVDRRGRVLVADTHYHRVMIYDRDGHELGRFGTRGTGPGQFELTTDVAEDDAGGLYVSEYGGNDRISRFSADGVYMGSFGGPGSGPAALQRPQGLVWDPQGWLWVTDATHHRVCRFSPDGRLLGSFGEMGAGPGQLKYPYGLALRPDGTLLVSEFGNNRVQRFDRSGASLGIWGGTGREPGRFLGPWGVAAGPGGRVYVLDSGNNRVQVFEIR